jgi:5,10-methylenetetrahydrofolate reductase
LLLKCSSTIKSILTLLIFAEKKVSLFLLYPGIKPVRSKKDLELLPQVFNIDIPEDLASEIENAKDNNAVKQIGIEWTSRTIKKPYQLRCSCRSLLYIIGNIQTIFNKLQNVLFFSSCFSQYGFLILLVLQTLCQKKI